MKAYSIIEKYIWVLNLVLLILLGRSLAKVTTTAVRVHYLKPAKIIPWQIDQVALAQDDNTYSVSIPDIEKRNIFKMKVMDIEPKKDGQPNPELINPTDFMVIGIIFGKKYSVATVLDKKENKKSVVGIGDTVRQNIFVDDIQQDKVIVVGMDGNKVALLLDFKAQVPGGGASAFQNPQQGQMPPGQPSDPGTKYTGIVKKISETEYQIDREGFQAALANLNELVTQARLVPNFDSQRNVDGFRIMRVRAQSIFYELGLRDRDIIQRVNGIVLNDPTKGLELFQSLKDMGKFTIDFSRNNQKNTYNYEVR